MIASTPVRTPESYIPNAASTLIQVATRSSRVVHTLHSLFEGLPVLALKGRGETPVQALCTDSRRVVPGALFFAMPGLRSDGVSYVMEAIHRGAKAIVAEQPVWVPHNIAFVQVIT